MKLSREFYSRNTVRVARELLGKTLVHRTKEGVLKGMIVETEAYFGHKDPGSHAFGGKITPRNKIMYQRPGTIYVYFTYGNHWMLNFVTEREGVPGAVLIRALEPLEGLELMKKLRGTDEVSNFTNGPGKLTQAMSIDKMYNGKDATTGSLFVEDSKIKFEIVTTTRIGLSMGEDLPMRFYIRGNEFVSRK
jgi:DNA-3-methyladenine glycosylase